MRLVVKSEDQRRWAHEHLDRMFAQERQRAGLLITIEPYRPPATSKQKAKLFAMLNELANESGNESGYLRAYFEHEHGPTIVGTSGNAYPKPMSEYSREEASVMIEHVIRVAAEHGYTVGG